MKGKGKDIAGHDPQGRQRLAASWKKLPKITKNRPLHLIDVNILLVTLKKIDGHSQKAETVL